MEYGPKRGSKKSAKKSCGANALHYAKVTLTPQITSLLVDIVRTAQQVAQDESFDWTILVVGL
jgi:hypothetical protein